MKLWKKILIGLVLGMAAGIIFGPRTESIKFVGDAFISALKMLIGPLVFASLVTGVTSMNDPKKLGRVGIKTLFYYLATTAVAVIIGLILGVFFQPGAGVRLEHSGPLKATAAPSMIDTLVSLIPSNPVNAFATDNILQVIVFALLLGLAINFTGEKGKPVAAFIDSFAEVMFKLTMMVMELAPFGVFALIAWVSGKFGLAVLLPLMKVILVVYAGCLLHYVITYGGLLALVARVNPLNFARGMIDAQLVAFSTASSSGTLPVNMQVTQKNLGVSESISSFVLPLGATINMDGTAIYQGVAALFIAQVYGIELTMSHYATIVMSATLASIGTAGVPGAGMIMLSLVLSSVGLPLEGIALIAGVDRILDMGRTTLNITGDAMVSVLIAKSEKELNLDIYNSRTKI
ncbi:MAG: dicarboxylate/amino acid:cation symporter [Candidatus Latescibacter sp.]|nr:dicarboxylate/amino acid:cation symporter [Candidatus Latescibacter sp.]